MFWDKKIIVAVHSGNFHPDDVFSVALLSILYNGKIKVIRTRDEKIYSKADFAVDIGFVYDPSKNRFDHHQEGGAGTRSSGVKYSSIGLLWKSYGEKVCGSKTVADILEKKLIEVIDADDNGFDLNKSITNGIYPFTLTDAIYSIGPTWKENFLDIDETFLRAVKFVKEILLREIKVVGDRVEAENMVEEIYKKSEDKRVIIFDGRYLPHGLLSNYPEPLFAVYKEKDGQRWRVTTIRKYEESFESRKNFPESWWGRSAGELAKISGIEDADFCRNGGVFAGAKSREGAIKLAKLALEK